MQPKRHDLLPSLLFFVLLGLLTLTFLAYVPRSVEVKIYDAHTGDLLPDAAVENLTPAWHRVPGGRLFRGANVWLFVNVSAVGYVPAEASWHAPHPWTLRGRVDVPLCPTQLTGVVRDAETGLPLPGAEVRIGSASLVADVAGEFRLSMLSGDTPVSVRLEGYESWHGQALWESHLVQSEPLMVDLTSNRVEGQVHDQETGDPLPEARVMVGDQQWLTDRSGYFCLRQVKPGDTLTVEREGFWPVELVLDDYLLQGEPLTVDLRTYVVKGQVHWQDTDEPIPGATVMAAGQQEITDQAGTFYLRRLQSGDTITVERQGFWPAEVVYAGQPLDIALRDRQAQVAVRSALEGVELHDLAVTRNGQRLESGSPGVFELRVCKAGELLQVTASGHWPAQVDLGTLQEYGGEIDLVLQPRVLTVTVRDGFTGWPLEGALVSSSPGRQANAHGQATLSPAIPGMMVTVEHPGYVSQTFQYDGLLHEMEVRLAPHTIRGVLVDANTGEPVPDAAFRQNGQTLLQSGPDGGFLLEELTQQSAFTVRSPGYRVLRIGPRDRASTIVPHHCGTEDGEGPCWEIRLLPFKVRGVYIPFGLLYSRQRTLAVLDMVTHTELNAVVVDVKGDRGFLAYASQLPLAIELDVYASGMMDIQEFLAICRQRGIYTIARLVVFKDNPLAHGKPEWAVKQADDTVWLDLEKLGWANPFREEVWNYNIGIAQEVAQLGFDEVQLDYLRFPSDGDLTQIVYEGEATPETKTTAIRTFIARMRASLEPYDVFLSADVFGLTMAADPQSGLGIGQRVIDIAPFVDYVCPMVYPSTFISGNMGIANPIHHPYKVVAESLRRGMALTSTRIRPWLQAYSLYGVQYGLEEQSAQRRAAEAVGANGWTFWNAGGRYDERLFRRRAAPDVERLDGIKMPAE